MTEILLKVALDTITLTPYQIIWNGGLKIYIHLDMFHFFEGHFTGASCITATA